MRILLRVAATLLVAVPLFVALVFILALAATRRAPPALGGGRGRALARGATGVSSRDATGAAFKVSR
jgi:hypothetical protein